jgi:hypothetical protein
VRFGSLAGEEMHQFSGITSIVQLEDGNIVVANGDPMEIRVFDSVGKFLVKHGRAGQGPGEFRRLDGLRVGGGDIVFALDRGFESRIFRFSVDAGFIDARTVSNAPVAAALPDSMVGAEGLREIFADGAMVVAASRGPRANYDLTPSGTPFRPAHTAVWLSSDLTRSSVLGEFGGLEQMFIAGSSGQRRVVLPLAGRRMVSAMSARHPSRFCVSNNTEPEVHCVDGDGTRRILRWTQDPVAIPAEAIELWKKNIRDRAARQSGGLSSADAERMIAASLIHDAYPPIQHIHVAADRSVLVASTDINSSADSVTRFRVFGANGQLLGLAVHPLRFYLMYLHGDRALGGTADDDGVQSVVMYRVVRAAEQKR